eukprot:2314313-Alexandrium_andersonii.AAC.1
MTGHLGQPGAEKNMPTATGSQYGAQVQPLSAARKASLSRRSMTGPGVVSCAAYGMQDAVK